MTSRLVILYRALRDSERTFILSQYENGSHLRIYYSEEQFIHPELHHIEHQALDVHDKQLAKHNKDSLYEIIKRGHDTVSGKKVLEWYSYKGQNFWFTIRGILTLKYRATVVLIKAIEMILQTTDMDQVESVDVYHSNIYLKNAHGTSDKVSYHFADDKSRKSEDTQSSKAGNTFSSAMLFLLRALIGFLKFYKIFGSKKHIVIINPINRQNIIAPSHTELFEGDPYVEYLLMQTKGNSNFAYLTEIYPQQFTGRNSRPYLNPYLVFYKYFKKTVNFETFLFLTLLNPFTYFNLFLLSKQLKRADTILREDCKSIYDHTFVTCISSVRKLMLYLYVRETAAKLMFKLLPVKSIGGINEQGPSNKPILNAGKSIGIPTYGIQHAAIVEHHEFYTYSKDDKQFEPWPDYTIVFGQYWKDILTRTSTYSPDQVISLGHLRTDCIPSLLNQQDQLDIHGLDRSRPIIMYASQPEIRGEEQLRDQFLSDVLQLSKELENIQFIIRPHPSDVSGPAYIKSIAGKVGTDNYVISETELYYDLAVSDIVIVYFSTVGLEAVYFNKHLILLDYLKSDMLTYLNKVGTAAADYIHLKEIVERKLEEKSDESDVKNAFIKNMALSIDGQATNRYVDFIETLTP